MEKFSPELGESYGWYPTGDPRVPLVPTERVFFPPYVAISVSWIYHLENVPHPFIDFFPIDKLLENVVISDDPFLRMNDLFFELMAEVIPEKYLRNEEFTQTAQSFYEEFTHAFYQYMGRIMPGAEDDYVFDRWMGHDHIILKRRTVTG